jgi:hypothetical protein
MRPQRATPFNTELVVSKARLPRIVLVNGQPVKKFQVRLDRKLSYALGWVLGDGYVNTREIDAIVSSRERDIMEPFLRSVLERFGKVFVVGRHGVYIIRCNSTVLSRVLCSSDGERYRDNIETILDSRIYAAYLIAGFWDADGGCYVDKTHNARAHLWNSNLVLLDKVAEVLENSYGIQTTIYKRSEYDSAPFTGIRRKSEHFDLYVHAKSMAS